MLSSEFRGKKKKKQPRNSEEGVVIQSGVTVPRYVLAGVEDGFIHGFEMMCSVILIGL